MILRVTCEEVLRKIKAEVASDTPEVQAGAGKPEPAGAASVHVTAVPAAADGVGPMQRQRQSLRELCVSHRLARLGYHCLACPQPLCSARLGETWYLYTSTTSKVCRTGDEEVQAPTPPGGFIKHLLASSQHVGVRGGARLSDDEVLQQACA